MTTSIVKGDIGRIASVGSVPASLTRTAARLFPRE